MIDFFEGGEAPQIKDLQRRIKELEEENDAQLKTLCEGVNIITGLRVENELLRREREEKCRLVGELLLFTEKDGTVVNGFRTKEVVQQLKNLTKG